MNDYHERYYSKGRSVFGMIFDAGIKHPNSAEGIKLATVEVDIWAAEATAVQIATALNFQEQVLARKKEIKND